MRFWCCWLRRPARSHPRRQYGFHAGSRVSPSILSARMIIRNHQRLSLRWRVHHCRVISYGYMLLSFISRKVWFSTARTHQSSRRDKQSKLYIHTANDRSTTCRSRSNFQSLQPLPQRNYPSEACLTTRKLRCHMLMGSKEKTFAFATNIYKK
jgi:hypothetical protein